MSSRLSSVNRDEFGLEQTEMEKCYVCLSPIRSGRGTSKSVASPCHCQVLCHERCLKDVMLSMNKTYCTICNQKYDHLFDLKIVHVQVPVVVEAGTVRRTEDGRGSTQAASPSPRGIVSRQSLFSRPPPSARCCCYGLASLYLAFYAGFAMYENLSGLYFQVSTSIGLGILGVLLLFELACGLLRCIRVVNPYAVVTPSVAPT